MIKEKPNDTTKKATYSSVFLVAFSKKRCYRPAKKELKKESSTQKKKEKKRKKRGPIAAIANATIGLGLTMAYSGVCKTLL